jgi:hypothetical protein
MQQPMVGEFKNGRGEFYDQESFNGRAIFSRNGFSDITPDSSSNRHSPMMVAKLGKLTGS